MRRSHDNLERGREKGGGGGMREERVGGRPVLNIIHPPLLKS